MSQLISSIALSLVRGWFHLYTLGLPAEIQHRRRAELESDLWEQQADADRDNDRPELMGMDILSRMMLGIADDLSWRISQPSRVEVHNFGFGVIATSVALFIFALGLGTLLGRDDAYGVMRIRGILPITLALAIVGSLGLRTRKPALGGTLALVLLLLASVMTAWSLITPLLGVVAAYLWFGARNRIDTDNP